MMFDLTNDERDLLTDLCTDYIMNIRDDMDDDDESTLTWKCNRIEKVQQLIEKLNK